MSIKLFFSIIAILLTFVAFIPYARSILRNMTKPHYFSWGIWGLTTMIVFFAQVQGKGGVGAWPIGVSGCLTLFIAFLAFVKRANIHISRLDWFFFLSALGSIPVWYLTADPVWAVILLTTIDLLGFGPTLRKAYDAPYQENRTFFSLFMARNVFALLALETYSLTTVLFPLSVSLACGLLILLVTIRRVQKLNT